MEQKKPLGWSGNFIGCGVDLMLLYLYADKKLKKAGEKVAENVSSMTGFNDSKNLLFMDDSSMFDIEVTLQKSVDIFWNIFCLWKVNYTISAEDIENHMKWLESVIDKRIDGIVSGKYRNKYSDVALLAAALGEVKESLGMIISKGIIINRYLERYSRYSAFRSALKKYLE